MQAPSTKTLLAEFRDLLPDDAKLIRKLAGAADDGDAIRKLVDARVPGTAKYVRTLHSDSYRSRLWRTTVALHAMNEVLGTYGVEGLGPPRSGDYAPPYEYLNAGDAYAGTLVYDRDQDRLFVGSWGDLAEAHPEWEGAGDHATIKRGSSSRKKSRQQLDRDIAAARARDKRGVKREVTERDWGSPARKRRMRAAGWKV